MDETDELYPLPIYPFRNKLEKFTWVLIEGKILIVFTPSGEIKVIQPKEKRYEVYVNGKHVGTFTKFKQVLRYITVREKLRTKADP